MNFEEAYDRAPGQGWLTKPEASLLWDAAKVTEGPILEVGSYCGRSASILAALGRVVYCVDPFDNFDSDLSGDEVQAKFLANMQDRGIDNVQLFRERIETWSPRMIGFAYLDGDHTYEGTKQQISIALAAGARSVCIHDYAAEGGGAEIARAIQHSPLLIQSIVERLAHCIVP